MNCANQKTTGKKVLLFEKCKKKLLDKKGRCAA